MWAEVCRQFSAPDEIIARLRKQEARRREVRPDLDTTFLERTLAREKERHALLLDLYLDGKLPTKEEFTGKRADIERAIQELESEIARRAALQQATGRAVEHAKALTQRVAAIRAGLGVLSFDRRVAFLRSLQGVRVVASPTGDALSVYGLLEEAVGLPLPRRRVSRAG